MSTAFDEESLDFLVALGIKRIKVPSGEITNAPLLRHMVAKGLPLIVSTGMAELDEVVAAVDVIRAARIAYGFAEPLAEMTILHHVELSDRERGRQSAGHEHHGANDRPAGGLLGSYAWPGSLDRRGRAWRNGNRKAFHPR
jgi:hypothetical protein